MNTHKLFETVEGVRIDRSAGIISGVSIITEGVAQGHDLHVDRITLTQMLSCIHSMGGQVKVKLDHFSGIDAIMGTLKHPRIEGPKLQGDLYLLPSHVKFNWVMDMAETMPGAFGLSASFRGIEQIYGGMKFARCEEILSVDLVDRPAANPDGLFSVPVTEANLGPIEEWMDETGLADAVVFRSREAHSLRSLSRRCLLPEHDLRELLTSGAVKVMREMSPLSWLFDGQELRKLRRLAIRRIEFQSRQVHPHERVLQNSYMHREVRRLENPQSNQTT